MFRKAKYIRTETNNIITFSDTMNHSDFYHLKPVSAGFVQFFKRRDGELDCCVYGRSISLNMEPDKETDEYYFRSAILCLDMLSYEPEKQKV